MTLQICIRPPHVIFPGEASFVTWALLGPQAICEASQSHFATACTHSHFAGTKMGTPHTPLFSATETQMLGCLSSTKPHSVVYTYVY